MNTANGICLQKGIKCAMFPMEEKFCNCLTEYMLQNHFHNRQGLASALGLSLAEVDGMHPAELTARLFKYCAVNQICLDSVIMQIVR